MLKVTKHKAYCDLLDDRGSTTDEQHSIKQHRLKY